MQNLISTLPQQLLASEHSLTQQLQADSGEPVIAQVIAKGYRRALYQEQRLLAQYGISSTSMCWVREVFLRTSDELRVLARILLPATEVALVPWLPRLGSQPLGEVLFNAYSPEREYAVRRQCSFAWIQNQFSLKARYRAQRVGITNMQDYLFRRSVLKLRGTEPVHFLVTECFV